MPICPLDNAHLCEPLDPIAQELGIVIQDLQHDGPSQRIWDSRGWWGGAQPQGRVGENGKSGTEEVAVAAYNKNTGRGKPPTLVGKLCSAIYGLYDLLQVTQLL